MESIIQLRSGAPHASLMDLIRSKQAEYPSDWVYRPVGIELELTNKCNIQCAGCGQRDEESRPQDLLSVDEYSDVARQAGKLPIFACSITGGETLMFLDRIYVLLQTISGNLDVYKINTNGYRFVSKDRSRQIFTDLKTAGFGVNNRFIKSVFVNSVNAASVFYDIFSFDESVLTINVTDKNIQTASRWSNTFRRMYEEATGLVHDDKKIPIREFMLNTIATLKRLDLALEQEVTIPELFRKFQLQYRSWKCLNTPPTTDEDMTTLMPKMVLRPNGDVMACPGYGYVHNIGNIRKTSLYSIVESANKNPVLRIMYTDGLPGLYKRVSKLHPEIATRTFSLSHDPCDICQILTNLYNYI